MKLILGLMFTLLGLLLVALLVFCAQRLDGQEVMELPIEKHTDSLPEGFWKRIQATPTNRPVVRLVDTNGVEAFSVTILSEFNSTNWYNTFPQREPPIASTYSSNVIARIVWKGRTNECVLERNP